MNNRLDFYHQENHDADTRERWEKVFENKNSESTSEKEECCWVCRTCGKESSYKIWKENETPRGWEDCEILGIRCGNCVKRKVMP